jgi:hypothetical protein
VNIIIVGGGTAGWLASFMLSKLQPNHSYTVIDSSKIGIIGVGESTTGHFRDVIVDPFFGTSEEEFIKETDATLKLGIYFKNWKKLGEDFYNPIDGSVTSKEFLDVATYYALYAGKNIDTSSVDGCLNRKGLSTFYKDGQFGNSNNLHAYHFDTHKTAEFLKKKSIQNGVTHIDTKVIDCLLSETGFITHIIHEDGNKTSGDFFIDASGFARVLISKVENSWISFEDNLPVNSVVPFVLDQEEDFEPVTKCIALSSGWLWQIPTRNKIGSGYVYCDKYISREEAIEEVETYLGRTIDPIKDIKFQSGRFEKVWSKNCLAIGLAGSFLEPLQSTNIHTTIVEIRNFHRKYLRDTFERTYSKSNEEKFSSEIGMMVDNFRDFVNLHYTGNRIDSPFWKMISEKKHLTDFTKNIIEISNHRGLYSDDFLYYFGCTGIPLWIYSTMGLGHITKETLDKIFSDPGLLEYSKQRYEDHINNMEEGYKYFLANLDFTRNYI